MIMLMPGLWVILRSYWQAPGLVVMIVLYATKADGYGGIARPIWEHFFKKVYADKTLGIDKDAKFVKPAEMENEINSADIITMIQIPIPGRR